MDIAFNIDPLYAPLRDGVLEYRIYEPRDPVNLKGSVVAAPGLSAKIDSFISAGHPWNNNTDAPARLLSERGFRAAIFSPPQHGGSTSGFSIESYVDACSELNRRLSDTHPGKVNGFGHSFGGYAIAISASQVHYSSLSLLGTPMSPLEVLKFMAPWLITAYDRVKGNEFMEDKLAKLVIAGINLKYDFGTVSCSRLGAFRIDSPRSLLHEIAGSVPLDHYIDAIPRDTRIMLTFLDNDGFIYQTLTEGLLAELKARWLGKRPGTAIFVDKGNHIYSRSTRSIFKEPGFDAVVDRTSAFFMQTSLPAINI